MLSPNSAVVAQGRWRLKNVRENSRLTPWNGSEIDHQTSAWDTRSVAPVPKCPRWYTSRVIGSASTAISTALGISSSAIWRTPLAIVRRRSSLAPRAAKRDSVGNRIVAIEIENRPCGSW